MSALSARSCVILRTVFLLFVLATPFSVANAAVPSNDICAGAIAIPGNGPFPYFAPMVDLTDALDTNDGPPPVCQSNVTRGVWYRITPRLSGFYEFSTCDSVTGTTEEDTVMLIYEAPNGCPGPYTPIACTDDSCRRQSELLVELTGSVRYYILVWQYKPEDGALPTAGSVELRVNRFQPPANESCLSADVLTLDTPVIGSTLLAANDHELADQSCFDGVKNTPVTGDLGDVAYTFVAPEAGDYSFRVSDYAGGNLVLYLAGSCPTVGSPALVTDCLGAGNRSTASTSEEVVCVPLAAFQQVYVIVDEHTVIGRPGEGGGFILEATLCDRESEPNDFPQNANIPVCGLTGTIAHVDDQDFYSLGIPVEGSRVFAMVDGESAWRTDFDLRVTTETDVLEYDRQDNDFLFGNFSPNIAGTPLTGVPSYVSVTFFPTFPFDGAEPYHLYAVVQPPIEVAAVETEPNDVTLLANQSPRNYFSGTLTGPAPSPDVDYFEIQAEAGDLVFLSLDGDPTRDDTPIDASVAFLTADGTSLMEADDPSDRSSTIQTVSFLGATDPYSPGESMVYRVAESGTYYVRVRIGVGASANEDGVGDYLLSIAKNCVQGSSGELVQPNFLSASIVATNVVLSLEGAPGASYRIEASETFGDWSTLGLGTADGTGRFNFEDSDLSGQTRYYRAVWP